MRFFVLTFAILTATTPAMAQGRVPPSPPGSDIGPWQMMTAQTHDDLPGNSGVYLLNTRTGTLLICVFAPAAAPVAYGCRPMPVITSRPGN